MPDPNAAPQMPGKVILDLTPGKERIEVDGFRLEQMVTAIKVSYSVQKRHPVLLLDLLPGSVEVTGAGVEMDGEFRNFLIQHGWQPPR
jgi:hypothetical protein